MDVNKQWLELHQSMKYKSLNLFRLSGKEFNKIVCSSIFQPGKCTKRIRFHGSLTPYGSSDSFDYNLDPHADPLHLLMKYCPNVEYVEFPQSATNKDWAYFSAVLTSNDYWKLRSLPVVEDNNPQQIIHYYKCAYHMCSSLSKLCVMQKIKNGGDSIKNLTQIKLCGMQTYNLMQYNNITELQLAILQEEVPNNVGIDDITTYNDNNHQVTTTTDAYNNIKDLTVTDHTPSGEELLTLMKKFKRLQKLTVTGYHFRRGRSFIRSAVMLEPFTIKHFWHT